MNLILGSKIVLPILRERAAARESWRERAAASKRRSAGKRELERAGKRLMLGIGAGEREQLQARDGARESENRVF